MLRRFYVFLFAAFMIGFLCSCSGETVVDNSDPTSSAAATEPVRHVETFITRSLLNEGNNYRLKRVLDKITSGEDVSVGFIGGSITEGYNASAGNNYARLVTSYLDHNYSDGSGHVRCVNAGLGGTPSVLGLIRADDDLLNVQPDLIFIEFAVNDAQSFVDKQAFESLVRKCLLQNNEPAVILLYSVTENGYTCQNDMAFTGFYYDLPSVSVRDAIFPEIESGSMIWSDWSDDVHPHNEGHALYCEFIMHLIDSLYAQEEDAPYVVPETGRIHADWSQMKMYDRDNLSVVSTGDFAGSSPHSHFRSGFSHQVDGDNTGITFEVTGSSLFVVYKLTQHESYGTAEVLVDGNVVAYLDGCTPDGWNNPVTQMIFSDKESAVHQITIRMQEGDENKKFDLLCLGVAE